MKKLNELNLPKRLVENLDNLSKSNRLPHAILLESDNIQLKNDLSLVIAAMIQCQGEEKPCGKCPHCSKIFAGNHPDVIVIDPEADGSKTFKIDAVRNMRKDAYIVPNESNFKVYILKSADKMQFPAQNALLKTIEEPPAHARFILECQSKALMLETVHSRVTSFNNGNGNAEQEEARKQKAYLHASNLAQALTSPTELEFMRLTAIFESDKDALQEVLPPLRLIFRDALAISSGSNIILSNDDTASKKLASHLPAKKLIKLIEGVNHIQDCLGKNANKNLLTTRLCSVLRNAAYDR